jgi:Phage tail sheath protein.
MIGNNNEPGVTSTVKSAPSVPSSGGSAGNPVIVGSADLETGEAQPASIEAVEESADAQRLFGKESRLTRNAIDALNQGAQPVLCVAVPTTMATMELSELSAAYGQITEPALESNEYTTVTVSGQEVDIEYTLRDPEGLDVPSGEVYINPSSGEFALSTSPSTGTIEYMELDYAAALQAVVEYTGDIDFVVPLKERDEVTTAAVGAVNQMETEENLALVLAGLPHPVDADGLEVGFDTSRLQLFGGVRQEDFGSSLGALAGLRAELGLTSTPINQQVPLRERPEEGLDIADRGILVDKNVVPLERIGNSVRVADDLTTVSIENSDEQNYKYGFSRLAVDFLIETVHDLEEQFIGSFNSPGTIAQLEDLLNEGARPLSQSNVIYSHEATVTMISPTTARVTFRADVAEPIRFIDNDFIIGQDLSLESGNE